MKKHRKAKKFLEELCKVPNVSVVCNSLGLSRNTIYRWREDDPNFRKEMGKALLLGEETVNDMAHGKMFAAIQRGEKWAIMYWLNNHHKNYIRPRSKSFLAELMGVKKPEGFEVIIRQGKGKPTSNREQKKDDNLSSA